MKTLKRFPAVDGSLGWYESRPVRRTHPVKQVTKNQYFDYIVVGAGFTGLSTAGRLAELEPDSKIAVVDALMVGQGTSGRNAGFIIDLPHNLDSNESSVLADTHIRELNCFAISRLDQIRQEQGDNVYWNQAGKYMAAHEEKHFKNLDSFTKTLDSINSDYEIVEGADLESRLGTGYYKKAVYTSGNVLVNPAALVVSVAKNLPENVKVFENSKVTSVDFNLKKLYFDNGVLTANTIILATNSFTEEFGGCKNKLAPVFTYASLTKPLNEDALHKFKKVSPWGVTSAHPAGTTVRFTSDNRILIRNSFDVLPDLLSNQKMIDEAKVHHRSSFMARFPSLNAIPFEYSWGGMLCMTMNHEPVFSESYPGVYAIAAMNGVGIAKGTYLGYYMAEMIKGNKSEDLDFILNNSNPSWVPPDPFKTIGARVRLSIEQRTAKGEK
ncbi:NAD(P)/FAD-dependent oxidoreductase [Psychrobacter sp. SZ93C1]|uniref:NAD(P)/FAD-dependent oxidoreductase n=1 Tax=Psychrobacter sp. SZ93C1 TaxID=2792058 RepID=UPI0018CCB06A|nr:FAD-binding oxidoreductase [Psychrobacter sp. SZ93C1]MBH0066238.1 FAD-binding oxidoreductase [Psychrobacter sp. SZ93C1]